jgi:hypothetical protein
MRKKISIQDAKVLGLCVILGLTCSSHALSQEIFIENGISLSTMLKKFKQPDAKYEFAVGINFLHSDYFFLTGSVGYTGKGGEINVIEVEDMKHEVINNKYITLNTVFNLKKTFRKTDLYLGVGPRVDFRISSSLKKIRDESNSTILGLKCNTGINHHLANWLIGINFSYLPSFTNFQSNLNLKDKTFTFGMIIGRIF